VAVDHPDQFASDLAGEHHPDHVHGFRSGHPQAAAELAGDAEPVEHRRDLRPAAVNHHRLQPGGPQEHHVLGEGPFQVVVDHGVAAVLDHRDRPAEALQPGQRLDQHSGLLLGVQQREPGLAGHDE